MSPDTDHPQESEQPLSAGADRPSEVTADWLDGVLPAWVDDGLIDAEQAAAIRRRHGLDGSAVDRSPPQSRLVTAVSAVGAALVGAGLIVFLGTNWESIPRFVRTLLLLLAPPAAFGFGYQFTAHRDSPRVGHALWTLGAVLTGPSLVLLNDLYTLNIEIEWLLAAWFGVALIAGEAYESWPTLGLAFGLTVATLVALIEPRDPIVPIATLGIVLFGLSGLRAAGPSTATDANSGSVDRLVASYRIAGVGICTLGLLSIAASTHRWYVTELGAVAGLMIAAALAVMVTLGLKSRTDPTLSPLAVWAVAAGIVVALSTAAATAVPEHLPELGALLFVHGLLLGLLLGVVAAGYLLATATLITVAVGLVFVQLAVFLTSTVGDALPTSVALVVTGSLLLVVAVGLERGRRSLLDRL